MLLFASLACLAAFWLFLSPPWNGSPATRERASVVNPLFDDVTGAANLDFVHDPGPSGGYFYPEIMGSGAALFDYDRDGDLDVFLVNGGFLPQRDDGGPTDTRRPTNRLFEQTAPGRFADVTASAGLTDHRFGMGVAVGDINNDGYPDLYVTNVGADRLHLNQRDGSFREASEQAGINNPGWGTAASFLDFDRDGWLDLMVTNYVDFSPRRCTDTRGGGEDYCGPQVFPATTDRLYRNVLGGNTHQGDQASLTAHFEDVSARSGIARKAGRGLGVLCADFNDDHRPDIYVANDQTANFLWINTPDGVFEERAILYGCAYNGIGRPEASMGIAWGDVDRNGTFDLFLTHLEGETHTLYARHKAPGFQDVTQQSGLAELSFARTGFGTALADVDHDGDSDLIVVNGRVKRPARATSRREEPCRLKTLAEFWNPYAECNQVFLNERNGKFRRAAGSREAFLTTADVSRGLAVGDVDGDGDLDLLVTNTAGQARLYFNEADKQGNWLQVRAVLPQRGGRDAYGAVVSVVAGNRRWQRLVQPGSSYLSSNSPWTHFGLGRVDRIEHIEVVWPDGTVEQFAGGDVGRRRIVRRGEGRQR